MRISVIQLLLLLCFLTGSIAREGFSQDVLEQKISLKVDRSPIKLIFSEIEKLSEIKFIYSPDLINANQKVSVNYSNTTVAEVLSGVLTGLRLNYAVSGNQIVIKRDREQFKIKEEEKSSSINRIQGRVLDENGSGFIGVTVRVKGTINGTSTDENGNFNIEANPGDELVFSFVGYVDYTLVLDNSTQIEIRMKTDSKALEEIVVIGYGTVKKSDLTGSLVSIKEDEIQSLPTTNVIQAMNGRAAGVYVQQNSGAPGAPISVRIRGIGSIQGSNEPLYVIDGFPTNDITILNSSEVASVEILKDASATAIYGSRGANGVVLITTKQGKSGKARVSFNSGYSMQYLRKKLELMNAEEYASFVNETLANSNANPFFSQEQINKAGTGFDWQDALFKNAAMIRNSLNISGGSEATRFAIGLSAHNQQGIIKRSDYNRYSLVSNIVHDFNKKSRVSLSTKLSRINTDIKNPVGGNRGGGIIGGTLSAPPTLSPYNEDGTYRRLLTAYPFISNSLANPINSLNEATSIKESNLIIINADFTYSPIPELTFKILGGIESRGDLQTQHVTNNILSGNSSANIGSVNYTSLLNENTVSYNKTFNDKHSLSSVLGFTYQDFTTVGHSGGGTGYISDVVEAFDIGAALNPNIPSSSYRKSELLSGLGRVNYSFDNKYLFTASMRADGASQFSKGNKWGYFPSAAFAWRISNEDFFFENSLISNMKLRTSWGRVGSQAIAAYTTLNLLYSGNVVLGDGLQVSYAPGTRLPQNLKWETSETKNIGFDLGFLNNRYNMSIDYYIKDTKDLLNTVGLPSSMGYNTAIRNIGGLQNKGIEVALDAKLLTKKDFLWDVNLNFSSNRNKITRLVNGRDIFGGSINVNLVQDDLNVLKEGQPVGRFWGYLEDGYDDKGSIKFKDLDGDGIISSNDKTFIGDPNPDFIYGLQSNMSFKGIEFSFFFQGTQGNDIFNVNAINNTLDYGIGLNMPRAVYLDHWTPTNTDAKYPIPRLSTNVKASDRFVEDGSYLRLKNIELAYKLEMPKSSQNSLRFYMSAQNLLTLTRYSWWDPEVNSLGGNTSVNQGIDYYTYPTAKSITFGVQANF